MYQDYIIDKGRIRLDQTISTLWTDALITKRHTWRDYCLYLLSYLHIGDDIVQSRDDGGGTECKAEGFVFALCMGCIEDLL